MMWDFVRSVTDFVSVFAVGLFWLALMFGVVWLVMKVSDLITKRQRTKRYNRRRQ